MASIWDLPVVFVLENNHYGVSTRIERHGQESRICPSARRGYGIPGVRVDGFDVLAVYEAATAAVARARAGDGPTLLVTESYRIDGHYAGEPEVYRDRAEVAGVPGQRIPSRASGASWRARVSSDRPSWTRSTRRSAQEIEEAIAFAKASPEPDPATAMDYIYA